MVPNKRKVKRNISPSSSTPHFFVLAFEPRQVFEGTHRMAPLQQQRVLHKLKTYLKRGALL